MCWTCKHFGHYSKDIEVQKHKIHNKKLETFNLRVIFKTIGTQTDLFRDKCLKGNWKSNESTFRMWP